MARGSADVERADDTDILVKPTGTLHRLAGFLAPYRMRVALAIGLTVPGSLLSLPAPLLVQAMIDRAATRGGLARMPWYFAGLIAVFAAQAGVAVAMTRAIGPVGLGLVRDLRHRLYARLQRLDLSYYDRTPTGAIVSRLMDDVGAVQSLVTGQTMAILTDAGTTLSILAILCWRDAGIASLVAMFLLVHAGSFRLFSGRIRAGSDAVRRRLDAVFGRLKETLDGAMVVKVCAGEDGEVAGFARRFGESHGSRLQIGRLSALFSNVTGAISGVGTSLVFAVGAMAVVRGGMTPGEVVSTTALAGLLFGPVARLADLASVFQQAAASIDRLGEMLDLRPSIAEPESPVPMVRPRGAVAFDGVAFAYRPGHLVLQGISLVVEPGMKVALVGPTGCGKTTLMNLVTRFYDPTAGEIRLDGTPIRRLSTADLRRQIGVVPQEPLIFARSLADNIRYGVPDASDDRVEAAARAALVHPFAQALPEGYHTTVGEGGHKLSQGERQRLVIARAFCKDPSLVILDEATSALDPVGEALIQASLSNLLRDRTAFIIAHRLATVVDADLIVVMDGGRIVQVGTHRELLAEADGLYRRLCLRQFGEPDPADAWRPDVPTPHRPIGIAAVPVPPVRASA
jgi:ABC-type multidrug transport system fused ATPase/permease subunit